MPMRGPISNRTLLQPRSLADALKMLRDEGPLVPMAGCTDLYVSLNFGTLKDTRFLNLWGLDALRTIERRGEMLTIGALATHSDLIRSPLVRKRIPMLAAAAREVGGVQIQHRGTLGGNVANASPAGDTLPVLAAADAVVVLRSAAGTRRIPFTAFYTGYRQTVRHSDELIVAFEVPAIAGTQWFRKVGTRAAQAISDRRCRRGPIDAWPAVAPCRRRDYIALGGSRLSCAPRERRRCRRIDAGRRSNLVDEIAPIDDIAHGWVS
jgi:CO/xanthine dehydrogenase FAD-binding subunit